MGEKQEKNPVPTETEDDKEKRVKLQIEGEDEQVGEGEMGRKKMKRFQLPDLPRWWQAKIIQYAYHRPIKTVATL